MDLKSLIMYRTIPQKCIYLFRVIFLLQISNEIIEELLPVMVWIHGGGFDTGSGGYSLYGPQYFMDEDVIIVAINYRIGPLGNEIIKPAVNSL